ncbi:hypothetical protein HV433_03280 [Bacillus sporothermodurans]|uniref:hypothetical protein n=1 Tax=Heyndrickxia sporothermodurans TaxID=46224 RepID=UPI00192ACA83|nr:hypothetical protein [Heyndrickxia sporothermodurans]MBL5791542.1 hypothetical protein [Heyndrickxia sporothermodurans]MBL5852596.1 hypothetical protein [Heyndrickxia sporothermodurans]
MSRMKPYRIYDCDPINNENDDKRDRQNNDDDKSNGNGNGNGNDVVKIQGIINEYGDLTSTGGNGGTALATAANNFAVLANIRMILNRAY